MKHLSKLIFILLFQFFLNMLSAQQLTPLERSVVVQMEVVGTPPAFHFTWLEDVNFDGTYSIYKRSLNETGWENLVAELPADAIEWTDAEIEEGVDYEYAFFKKKWELLTDTIAVNSGSEVTFSINNIWGDGICCSFGTGWYEILSCGETVATGSEFGFGEESTFEVCDNGNATENVIINIWPDMLPHNTYWSLNDANGNVIQNSGNEVGLAKKTRYGFIYSGVNLPPIEHRGTILLMVDDSYLPELELEINQLQMDFIRDGWRTIIQEVSENEGVIEVKAKIQAIYNAEEDLKAVLLLGEIPVPYSGNFAADGHWENHWGAWAADTYYAEMDGEWTDTDIDNTSAFLPWNKNVPGDGKFDQSLIPSGKTELQIGRIDLSNLPAFTLSEIELTRQYLNKNHEFKIGNIQVERRALMDDNLGHVFGAPSASGWRNFSTMFGAENIVEADYFETLKNESYLWSYASGGGSHISAGGVGTSFDFATDSLLNVFSMMFGSQFGDWDNDNNFLRVPLAQGLTLTNVWAGNPPYSFHHMSMGYNIGYSVFQTQNSDKDSYNPGPQLVHTTLLGDPTLRMHPVLPAQNLVIDTTATTIDFEWIASADENILGYHLYRADSLFGKFERVNEEMITENNYSDINAPDGFSTYMLRAVKLESSASGTYQNLSLGMTDSVYFEKQIIDNVLEIEENGISIFPNPAADFVRIDFEDGIYEEFKVRILGIDGKAIFEGENLREIDVSELESGVYVLEIETENEVLMEKFLKI